ncbi:MAG: TIGR00159 family protein, partial [Candidatus Dormiibacterota bacterium]
MSDLLRNIHFFLQSLSWRDGLDVLVVAFLLYQLLKLIRGTQAVQLLLGLGVIFAVGWAAQLLHLRLLEFIF